MESREFEKTLDRFWCKFLRFVLAGAATDGAKPKGGKQVPAEEGAATTSAREAAEAEALWGTWQRGLAGKLVILFCCGMVKGGVPRTFLCGLVTTCALGSLEERLCHRWRFERWRCCKIRVRVSQQQSVTGVLVAPPCQLAACKATTREAGQRHGHSAAALSPALPELCAASISCGPGHRRQAPRFRRCRGRHWRHWDTQVTGFLPACCVLRCFLGLPG